LVLLLLAVMWVAAGIWYFQGRPIGRSADSIGTFRRHLRVLERTGPIVIDPAHRLRDAAGFAAPPLFLGAPTGSPSPAVRRRREAQRRRRDIVSGLLLAFVGSMLLGWVPGLRVMWMLAAVLALALAGYVFLLVQRRNLASERAMKVRYLPDHRQGSEPALMLRRSAN
jgi:hypothetical protein